MKTAQVIVAGTDLWHDLLSGGLAIQRILLDAGVHATLRVGLERFTAKWEPVPDVYVVNAMDPRISAAGCAALSGKIAAGTGLVAVHATNVGEIATHGDFLRLIGSRFVTHPPFARFTVRTVKAHPVTDGVGEYAADDEPYEMEWVDGPAEVLATGAWNGADHPLVYVKQHGNGRICYVALGHDGRAWSNPSFRRLVAQAAVWAAGG
jgi:type 1 glutamine amidotransferase